MNGITDAIQTRFLPFLDRQINHLERMREFLDAFRGALIRRDLETLGQMQDRLAAEADRRQELDGEMEAFRRLFAGPLGCRPDEVCVSKLAAAADAATGRRLRDKQRHARELVESVKNAHLATELLLRECARINRRMLEVIVGRGSPAPTYDARGRAAWQSGRGLMNVKL